jgi:hypothetical protein
VDYDEYRDAADAAADAGNLKLAFELLDRYQHYRLAQIWCKAESTELEQLEDKNRQEVFARVRRVLGSGPGDLTVEAVKLFQELNDLDDKPREYLQTKTGDHDAIRRLHVYDSFISDASPTYRLFSSADRIGYAQRSNLEVPGQLTFEDHAILTSWSATVVPDTKIAFGGIAQLHVQGRREASVPIGYLLRRRARLWLPVSPRSTTHVEVFTNRDRGFPQGVCFYIHLEGWRTLQLA